MRHRTCVPLHCDLAGEVAKVCSDEKDFMHQKVVLVDDQYGVISTANFDNRSFFLNFEVSCIVHDEAFCQNLAAKLESDLENTTELTMDDLESRTFTERLGSQVTRLLAPLL